MQAMQLQIVPSTRSVLDIFMLITEQHFGVMLGMFHTLGAALCCVMT